MRIRFLTLIATVEDEFNNIYSKVIEMKKLKFTESKIILSRLLA